ncbi:O-antigen ligase family protein [Hydrocarboniclastica marina]|uniref:O-antigen ligase-related domain-containing protein n=1 Tax=Hydrocarboniclastica marina TaxID=2259620 RepID=A0A4P7XGY7_9ALTE|nr:O-antigen ligase family protein [Hydrocarboniclastica marina]QCF26288.1 hypothetical protein soil367_10270 [Hydrocarboniclastica marina]
MKAPSAALQASLDGSLEKETLVPYRLYLLYLASFFLHIPGRVSILGAIRMDFLLVGAITFFILGSKATKGARLDKASQYLLAIFVYSILVLPLVEWPGSVINNGLVAFIKGAIFYFFTVNLIVSERRLKVFLTVFIVCNVLRVVEPLFMNITSGYLGSRTHLGGGEFAGRLSGAPSDTINPNGLAFVIASILPFLHYIFSAVNKKAMAAYLLVIPVLFYAMALTMSRSGIVALAIIAFGVFMKSKRKPLLFIIGIVGLIVIWASLNDLQKDRYLSLVSSDTAQSSSAEGRIDGWFRDFEVAMNRPIIGHGLGTSREASWNIGGNDQPAHILWAEIWQEIGFIGLVLFILYLKTIIKNFLDAGKLIKKHYPPSDFLYRCTEAMQVWLMMNLLFSLASYGLKSYEWYLFGGLSVVLVGLAKLRAEQAERLSSDGKRSDEADPHPFPLASRAASRW